MRELTLKEIEDKRVELQEAVLKLTKKFVEETRLEITKFEVIPSYFAEGTQYFSALEIKNPF